MNSTKFSKYLEISPIEANKIEMAILFLLNAAFEKNKQIYKMHIYKFISFLEWTASKEFSNHFFLLDFTASENGPVPYSFMKYIDENNGTFSYFTYKKLNKENENDPLKTLFSFKSTSPTYFKDYFNWKYFSDKEKKLLYKATEWILSFKTTKELSNLTLDIYNLRS